MRASLWAALALPLLPLPSSADEPFCDPTAAPVWQIEVTGPMEVMGMQIGEARWSATGSAWLAEDGRLITAEHVITDYLSSPGIEVTILYQGSALETYPLIAVPGDVDVATLHLPTEMQDEQGLPTRIQAPTGGAVWAIGYAGQDEGDVTVTGGLILAESDNPDAAPTDVPFSAPVYSGMSGGALVTCTTEGLIALGVVTSAAVEIVDEGRYEHLHQVHGVATRIGEVPQEGEATENE